MPLWGAKHTTPPLTEWHITYNKQERRARGTRCNRAFPSVIFFVLHRAQTTADYLTYIRICNPLSTQYQYQWKGNAIWQRCPCWDTGQAASGCVCDRILSSGDLNVCGARGCLGPGPNAESPLARRTLTGTADRGCDDLMGTANSQTMSNRHAGVHINLHCGLIIQSVCFVRVRQCVFAVSVSGLHGSSAYVIHLVIFHPFAFQAGDWKMAKMCRTCPLPPHPRALQMKAGGSNLI